MWMRCVGEDGFCCTKMGCLSIYNPRQVTPWVSLSADIMMRPKIYKAWTCQDLSQAEDRATSARATFKSKNNQQRHIT